MDDATRRTTPWFPAQRGARTRRMTARRIRSDPACPRGICRAPAIPLHGRAFKNGWITERARTFGGISENEARRQVAYARSTGCWRDPPAWCPGFFGQNSSVCGSDLFGISEFESSLSGRVGVKRFQTAPSILVLMSLAGILASLRDRHSGLAMMGSEGCGGPISRLTAGIKTRNGLASSIVPAGTSLHRVGGIQFSPIAIVQILLQKSPKKEAVAP
jgi:hypothetical protein